MASTGEPGERPRVILRVVPPAPPEPPKRRPFSWRGAALAGLLMVGGLALAAAQLTQGLSDAEAKEAPASALAWRPGAAPALARQAELLLGTGAADEKTLAAVEGLARRALAADPLNGSAFRSLALAAGLRGDMAGEARLMTIAGDRMKRDIPAVSWLVADRLKAGRYVEAAERADGLLRAWPISMHAAMTSQLTDMAGSQGGAITLARLLDTDPPWRARFLTDMAKRGDNPGAAMALFTAMRAGRRPPSETETSALVNRLVKDGLYQEAFLVWAQLLPDEGIRNLADPYDGGFEGLPGSAPFNWQTFDRPGVLSEPAAAPGGEGRALYLRFTGTVPPPVLARQLLALTPGRHRLSGRWKADRLAGGRRLVWTLRCAERAATMAGEGEPLSGTSAWQAMSIAIEVPAGCTAQWLSLMAPGRGTLSGEAWFDDLKITRAG
jgi:hypothetical protein